MHKPRPQLDRPDADVSSRPAVGGPVTGWLRRWRTGERNAIAQLVPLVCNDLRQVARRQLHHESPGHTLSPTALVHETYLRLLGQYRVTAADRHGLLAIAGQTMRRILVDHARARRRLKRGGENRPISLEPGEEPRLLNGPEADEVIAIDTALARLAHRDPRAGRVVECRVFGGLTLRETADLLGISTKSVQRTWAGASAWLRTELRSERSG